MMADTFVDPALFRLRAFEVEWLEPLKTELSDLTRGRTAESDGTALLLHVLIAEADRWVTIGQQVGYFAQTSPSAYPLSLAEPPELEWLLGAIRSQTELPPGLGVREFSRALSEARDDLTAERKEFLRLVCFAEEVEWLERLTQIRAFAEELADRPEECPPSEMVDRVTWGLDGFRWDISGEPIHSTAESGRTGSETTDTIELQHHLPAKWRLGALVLLAKQSPVADRRLAELAEARASIAATIQGLTQIQHTAAAVVGAGGGGVADERQPTGDRRVQPSEGPGSEYDDDFNHFFRKEYPRVIKSMMYAGATFDEADDAVSQAMTKAYTCWALLISPAAWVRTVALRLYLKEAEKNRRRDDPGTAVAPPVGVAVGPPKEPDEHSRVIVALRCLPPAQWEAMALTFDGYAPAEIAELLHQNPNAVRSNLQHAGLRLRHELESAAAGGQAIGDEKEV